MIIVAVRIQAVDWGVKEKNVYYQKETSGTKKGSHKWQNQQIIEHKKKQ
jgi:hypothetical protein